MTAWGLLAVACGEPVVNVLPELPAVEVRAQPELPVAILPPEVCVGLLPGEDKFLPEEVEAVEGVEVVEATGDVLDVADVGDDAEFNDLGADGDSLADLPQIPATPPNAAFIPMDVSGSNGDAEDIHDASLDVDPCTSAPATCVGAAMPEWELYDFQPRSCGYRATYGLDLFKGHVTVVALLAAW